MGSASPRPAEGRAARGKGIPTHTFLLFVCGFPHPFPLHPVTLEVSEESAPHSAFLFR